MDIIVCSANFLPKRRFPKKIKGKLIRGIIKLRGQVNTSLRSIEIPIAPPSIK
jgi:hypothetical protein